MLNVILASSSPRRRELLSLIGLRPRVIAPEIDEQRLPGETQEKFLERLSIAKAMNVYQHAFRRHLVIGADTIVCLEGEIIGKPRDRADAASMLGKLSGQRHEVWTGLALLYGGETHFAISRTSVFFKSLTAAEIDYYLAQADYGDKAGAYAVQGLAAVFIRRIEGCYFNVMGFPLHLFYSMLDNLGIRLFEPGPPAEP